MLDEYSLFGLTYFALHLWRKPLREPQPFYESPCRFFCEFFNLIIPVYNFCEILDIRGVLFYSKISSRIAFVSAISNGQMPFASCSCIHANIQGLLPILDLLAFRWGCFLLFCESRHVHIYRSHGVVFRYHIIKT
jgi:hypothetical protein